MKPLVSILLTVYEVKPEFLVECLNSILNQTYNNVEILVIDDCSPNTNYDFIKEISPKIKLIRNEVNLGMQNSINKLFQYVTGKYVIRLGADDLFDKTLLEKEVNILESNSDIGGVCCEMHRFGDTTEKTIISIRRPKKWDIETILNGKYGGTGYDGGMMYRASFLPNVQYDNSFKMASDFDFHLQLLEIAPITSIHEDLYAYRMHNTNLTKSVKTVERKAIISRIVNKHLSKIS